MSRLLTISALIAALTTVLLTPARAHHTFVVKYDGSKVVKVSGVVTSVSYANPHIHFQVQAGGTTWTVETESIPVAQGSGLTQAVLKEGAKVTLGGWPARDGSPAMALHTISVAGGPSATMRRTAR